MPTILALAVASLAHISQIKHDSLDDAGIMEWHESSNILFVVTKKVVVERLTDKVKGTHVDI